MKAAYVVALAVLAAACGHARISDKALEADLSRLDPAAVAQLEGARGEIGQAQGEVARAGQLIGEARQEHSLGEADQKAAEAEEARVKSLVEAAEARRRAADARHDYAEKLIDAREAAEEAAKCRAELAAAKLELFKYSALAESNPAAVADFKKSDFLDRVAECQRDLDDAQERAAKLEQEAKRDQQKWQELAAKVPATK